MPGAVVDVWWIPLGAGGCFVRANGRMYERVVARRERRRPLDVYHSALVVSVPDGRFVIENAWPIPGACAPDRGVVFEGPVFSRRLARSRMFRYEVRRWRDGVIADERYALGSPDRVSGDSVVARRLLRLVDELPRAVWGRDELRTGDMWNSNSVVAWLLARSGVPMDLVGPPPGGIAPGWTAGLVAAGREEGRHGPADGPSSPVPPVHTPVEGDHPDLGRTGDPARTATTPARARGSGAGPPSIRRSGRRPGARRPAPPRCRRSRR